MNFKLVYNNIFYKGCVLITYFSLSNRCAEGYMGQRCEFKDLDGSYLRKLKIIIFLDENQQSHVDNLVWQ